MSRWRCFWLHFGHRYRVYKSEQAWDGTIHWNRCTRCGHKPLLNPMTGWSDPYC